MLCRQLRLVCTAVQIRTRTGTILVVDEHQLKARITDSDVLRADVRVQVERLVARVRVAGQASTAVSAVSAKAAAVWICQVAVSTIIANSVVRVTLARAIQKTLFHITCGMKKQT